MHHMDVNETSVKKRWMGSKQECYMLFSTNPGSNTPQKQQLYGHLPLISRVIQVSTNKTCKDTAGGAMTDS